MAPLPRLVFSSALIAAVSSAGCERKRAGSGGDGDGDSGGGSTQTSGDGGTTATDGSQAGGGTGAGPLNNPSGPRYHPPEGFEDCVHAPVEENCSDGWCVLPPSCFVMGSPEDEWHRGARSEDRVAATLTHSIEIQQREMTRAEWLNITGVATAPPDDEGTPCLEDDCPIDNITWWEAIEAANLLSAQNGLEPCYAPIDCQNDLGQGRFCQGVAEPEKPVYECEGYRLPTRPEAEYAARAGTISTFYSGDITVYDTYLCDFDQNLDKIAWYCHNSGDQVHPGAGKLPNDFGLYDMIGNVREWTNDENRWGPSSGGVDPEGTVGTSREPLAFGGRFSGVSITLRTASVLFVPATNANARGIALGMRLVRSLPE